MIALRINDRWVEFAANTSVQVSSNSPLIDPDYYARSFSYPFRIPTTPTNRRIFSSAHRVDALGKSIYDATLYLHQQAFAEGELVIVTTTDDTIEVRFQNYGRTFMEDLADINIRTLLPTITVSGVGYDPVWTFVPTPGQYNYVLVIDGWYFNPVFPIGTPPTAATVVQQFATEINARYPNMAKWFPGNTTLQLYSEQVNIHPITMSATVAWTLSSAITASQAKQEAFINHVSTQNNYTEATHTFPLWAWNNLYQGNNPSFRGWVNPWFATVEVSENQPAADPQAWAYTFIPMVNLRYLLSLVATAAGVEFTGSYWNNEDFKQLIIPNNRTLDQVGEDEYPSGEKLFLNHYVSTYDLNRHVPDITAQDLLTQTLDFLGLYIYSTDGQKIQLREKLPLISGTTADYRSRAHKAYSLSKAVKKGFRLDYNRDKEDGTNTPTQLFPVTIGEGKTIIRPTIGVVFTFTNAYSTKVGNVLAPAQNRSGTGDNAGVGDNEYPLMLMYDRGLRPSSAGIIYRLATYGNVDGNNTPVGDRTLNWDGPQGRYLRTARGIIQLTQMNELQQDYDLSIPEILKVLQWRNTRRHIGTNEGEAIGTLVSIYFIVTPTELSPVSCRFLVG